MKKYFITGLIILLPVTLTLIVLFFLFDFFTAPFDPLVIFLLEALQRHFYFTLPSGVDAFLVRLISLVLLVIFVLLLGMLARRFIVRHLIEGTYSIFSRIPFIKGIFKVSRDVFHAILSGEGKVFKCPVMIPFPNESNYSVGFIVGEVPPECQSKAQTLLTAVFVPTAPHPISGMVILVPHSEIKTLDMSNEDAVRFLISCGMIIPEENGKK